jgi:hypothetical protein
MPTVANKTKISKSPYKQNQSKKLKSRDFLLRGLCLRWKFVEGLPNERVQIFRENIKNNVSTCFFEFFAAYREPPVT